MSSFPPPRPPACWVWSKPSRWRTAQRSSNGYHRRSWGLTWSTLALLAATTAPNLAAGRTKTRRRWALRNEHPASNSPAPFLRWKAYRSNPFPGSAAISCPGAYHFLQESNQIPSIIDAGQLVFELRILIKLPRLLNLYNTHFHDRNRRQRNSRQDGETFQLLIALDYCLLAIVIIYELFVIWRGDKKNCEWLEIEKFCCCNFSFRLEICYLFAVPQGHFIIPGWRRAG